MKHLLVLSLMLFSFFQLNAQIETKNIRQGDKVEYCGQHKKVKLLENNPDFLHLREQERAIFNAVRLQMVNSNSPTRQIYKIPIVFHVLHNGGVENISDEQIVDAVAVLNRDYRLLNTDANNVIFDFNASNPNAVATPADIEVEFVLATKTPTGACFNGITRTQSIETFTGDGQTQLDAIINGNDTYNGEWLGDSYLNIFVCSNIGGFAGYTYLPSDWFGNAMSNGIFVLQDYVGRIGTSFVGHDRVLTHEVGHWLNLNHTWGPNNSPGDIASCDTDDDIEDTPNTIGVTFCNLDENSCGPLANVENYMDYSYCSKMFTHGQRDWMQAALNSPIGGRNNLWTVTNLAATGADGNAYLCEADFSADKTTICTNGSIQFHDHSFNNVTSWNWSFPGAVSTSSTEQNPIATYNSPGTYSVTLVASDGLNNLSKTMDITVLGTGLALPILDGFEPYATTFTNATFWETYNPGNNATFQVSSNAAQTGTKSAFINNFSQFGTNLDELMSDVIDLSDIHANGEVTLSFRYSYRKKLSTNNEALYVLMSANCGETWSIKKSIQGNSLSSISNSNAWIPSQTTDWTTVHVTNISSPYWIENFRFKFRFEGNEGNNLYLDNINIYKAPPSEELIGNQINTIVEQGINESLSIFPNPVDNELNISYSVDANTQTSIQILDVLSKTVHKKTIQSITGSNLVVIGTENLAAGIYTAQISIGGVNYNKQFVVK